MELLVVVAVISLLIMISVASAVRVRAAARNFECRNKLRTAAFEFIQFADDFNHPYRGDSARLGRRGFYIEDFQERLYGISEFWNAGSVAVDTYRPSSQPLMCPSGPQFLQRRAGVPCEDYAVTPAQNVSVAFNMRLNRASVLIGNRYVLKEVRLTRRILEHPSVPLVFDVDGREAVNREVLPYYSAPPAGDPGLYGSGLFWFPSHRHGRRLNAGFVGGYVLSSERPYQQSGWDWSYQPPPE